MSSSLTGSVRVDQAARLERRQASAHALCIGLVARKRCGGLYRDHCDSEEAKEDGAECEEREGTTSGLHDGGSVGELG
jgi:hypothetical protein